jgi:hypothetical protein
MSGYSKYFHILADKFNISSENIEVVSGSIGRFALVLVNENESKYWIDTFSDEDDLISSAEQAFQEPEDYKPIYYVDLKDFSAREISVKIMVGLSELLHLKEA